MIESGQLAVGTVATKIDGIDNEPSTIYVHNVDNTDDLFLGGSDVTASNGLHLTKLETIRVDLNPTEELYVVSTKTGHSVSYLRQVI